jgi:hypothetical protein
VNHSQSLSTKSMKSQKIERTVSAVQNLPVGLAEDDNDHSHSGGYITAITTITESTTIITRTT